MRMYNENPRTRYNYRRSVVSGLDLDDRCRRTFWFSATERTKVGIAMQRQQPVYSPSRFHITVTNRDPKELSTKQQSLKSLSGY